MPEYRRVKLKGGTYFFTLVTYKRQSIFLFHEAIVLLKKSIDHVKDYYPFSLEAYCILPDHIHLIFSLPEDDNNYSVRISQIKRRFSKQYNKKIGVLDLGNKSRQNRRELPIWQRRFWDHLIRDENDLEHHIDYIHYNPVKHGLVNRVHDWKYSSFHDFVEQGYYDLSWGEDNKIDVEKEGFGE